jgi:hypothetical protein
MRATASATVFLLMNLIGQGFGPTTIGFLSDRFSARLFTAGNFHAVCSAAGAHAAHSNAVAAHGALADACQNASAGGIRYAMLALSVTLVWSSVHYFLASRHVGGRTSARANGYAKRG